MLVVPALCRHPPAMSSPLLRYRPPLCHRHSCSVIVPLLCQRHSYSIIVTPTLSSSLLLYHRHPIHRPPALSSSSLLCHRHSCSIIVPLLSRHHCSVIVPILCRRPPLHTLCALIVATALSSPATLLRHSDLSSLLLCHRPPALSPTPCSVTAPLLCHRRLLCHHHS